MVAMVGAVGMCVCVRGRVCVVVEWGVWRRWGGSRDGVCALVWEEAAVCCVRVCL